MWLLNIRPSSKKEKRLTATFCLCKEKNSCKGSNLKEVHFGLKGGSTYIDHKDDDKKKNYIARHKVNEDWTNPLTSGSLAKNLLWNKKTLTESIADFKKRFKL
jgi:hypothetical protein